MATYSGHRAKVVAAIDFGLRNGSSHCALSYAIDGGYDGFDNISMFPLNHDVTRVPTAILLKRNEDGSISHIDIGDVAHDKYSMLSTKTFKEYIYFEPFKIQLRDEESISREMKITASNGRDFYLLEVIALILQHLMIMLKDHLNKPRFNFYREDFFWVITVPAIWKCRGQQLIREAAYRAGLISHEVWPITSLTPTWQSLRAINMSDQADRLAFALEPECAALFCQSISSGMIASHSLMSLQGYTSHTSKHYMVLDIGDRTVDIAIYDHTKDGKIRSLLPPTTNEYGGMNINRKFSELLQKIVNDRGFNRFYKERNDDLIEAGHRAVIVDLVFQQFEKLKTHFGNSPDSNQAVCIRLDHRFVRFYGEYVIEAGVQRCRDRRIQFDDEVISIHFSYIRELFDEVAKNFIACMKEALEESPIAIDTVYLVGGFGGSQYIYEKVKTNLHHSIKVIMPREHKLATCKGAILFQRDPSVIKSRISEAQTEGFFESLPLTCDKMTQTIKDKLDIRDLDIIIKELTSTQLLACSVWYDLGLQLGLYYPTLKDIEEDYRVSRKCFRECMSAWLRGKDKVREVGGPSWSSLVSALDTIGEHCIAINIKEKYCIK